MNERILEQRKTSTSMLKPVPTRLLQRKCSCDQHTIVGEECEECRQKREGTMQRASVSAAPVNTVPSIVHDVLNSSGQPLDTGTRAFMEARFGHDFSGVRVHTDAQAATSARSVNALAYTVGSDMVFGMGQYTPRTMVGKRLIAHELAHTIQQGPSISSVRAKLETTNPGDTIEQKAELAARTILQEKPFSVTSGTPLQLARDMPDAGVPRDAGVSDANRNLQVECVKRLGGCVNTRSAGVPTADEITLYNKQCRPETNYTGTDVTPTDEECRGQVATPPPAPPIPLAEQKAKAHQAVVNFGKSTGSQAWPNLTRSTVADGLDQRIDNPSLINQSVLNACGPAAIVYMLASNNPVRFQDIVQTLFETGHAALDGETLSAGSDLRKNTPPAKMAQVDWMLLSSMRDSENAVFDFEGDTDEDFSAITTPGDLTHWMRSILKCKEVSWESSYLYGEIDAVRKAGTAVSAGQSVALLIDAAMLSNQPKEGKIGYPNHWVVLKSPVVETTGSDQGDKIRFSVWTWGEKNLRDLNLDKNVFVKTFYGAAICTL